jgi:vacuolar-type H+-ATPase subunit E/Vma4
VTTSLRRPAVAGSDPSSLESALEPVRRALLDDAARQADELVQAARAAAVERTSAAEQRATDEVERARRRARATAVARTDRAVAEARRKAHAQVLETDAEIVGELTARVRRAVGAMVDDRRYPALLSRLESLARRQLGDGANVVVDDADGGVVADLDGRRVDYRLTALADRALAVGADDLEESGT